MDTTATAVLIRKLSGGDLIAIIGQVGNGRVYQITAERTVAQLTEDQDIMATEPGARVILEDVGPSLQELDTARARVRTELDEATDADALSEPAQRLWKYRNITSSIGTDRMAVAVDVLRFPEGTHLALASDGVFQNLGARRMKDALSMAPLRRTDTLVADTVREAKAKKAEVPGSVLTAHDDDASLLIISRTP